jgi:hypothetical protein
MKKNQIILIGVSASVLLLFFMIVFKSDKDHAFLGTSKISIYVENGGNLSNSESLLQLIDIYSDASLPVKFTQTELDVYQHGSALNISSNARGMAKFRSFFNENFYTYDDRLKDLEEFKKESAEYLQTFKSTSEIPKNADIEVDISNGEPSLSYEQIKASVKILLTGIKRDIVIVFKTTVAPGGSGGGAFVKGAGGVDKPGYSPVGSGKVSGPGVSRDLGGDGEGEGDEYEVEDEVEVAKVLTSKDVTTSAISFEPGLPNVFSWTEDEGMTYDFTLKCEAGDCSTGLSVSKSNVSGGRVDVQASYAESTEKKYKVTLVIKSGGKILKTITKTVKILCS